MCEQAKKKVESKNAVQIWRLLVPHFLQCPPGFWIRCTPEATRCPHLTMLLFLTVLVSSLSSAYGERQHFSHLPEGL